jgi:uncharacterized protein YecT (DUF1311 family)
MRKTLNPVGLVDLKETFVKRCWFACLALISAILCAMLGSGFIPSAEILQSVAAEPIAQQSDCQKAATQLELNRCAALNAKAADRKLNQVYQQVQARYQDSQQTPLLVTAEVAWIKYRDASCTFSERRYAGGSIAPMIYSNCIERLTRQRTQELESYLQEGG